MKKEELKYYLNNFSKKNTNIDKKLSNRKLKEKLKEYLNIVYEVNDEIVKQIIENNYLNKKTDKIVIQELPISEATYYRIKKEILNILYELFILDGYVDRKDIVVKI